MTSFFAGYFSDKYGRRTVILTMSIILSISIISCEILQYDIFNLDDTYKFFVYMGSQYFIGFTSFTLYVVSYILIIELCTPEHSMKVSIFFINIYVIGELILLGAAYFLKDWHLLNWFIASYSLIVLTLISYMVPESPR